MRGTKSRRPNPGFSCGGLPMLVLAGLLAVGLGLTGASTVAAQKAVPTISPEPVPIGEPTPAPGAVPSGPEAGSVVPEPFPPGPPPGPSMPPFRTIPFSPGPPPYAPPPAPEPPPPGAICRPVPTVNEPVATLGVTVTWPAEGGGVLVLDVLPFSPAADAGLVRGDRILAINHQVIATPRILAGYICHQLPGTRIWIAYWRHGGIQSTNTVLVPREAIPGVEPESRPVPIWQADHRANQPGPDKHDVVLVQSTPR